MRRAAAEIARHIRAGEGGGTLLQACGNARLLAAALSLRDVATLYRRWSLPVGRDTERDVAGEHRELVDAVLRRDADAAAQLFGRRIDRTSQALRTAIGESAATVA
ncbi:FCD domain-containing protein [Streptomyces sp. NPDC096040]|uniref:FCD domain-containing protein n=1 Tax=Streptomyces sp. NPDC096040 TaxID=3155541 RepID=UPI003327E707